MTLALTWLFFYVTMRRAFPPQDWSERMHLNKVGRRIWIAMTVMLFFSLVYWMTR